MALWFEQKAPDMAKGWWEFYNAAEGEGKLDSKTKAAVALATAITGRCPHCTGSRIKKALAAGFSKEEIAEVIMEVALVASGTELFWAKEVYDKYLLDEEK
ncbi:MAG TPA: carboxymuconolactone decarboxylase family protein [Thermodesulfobacteriota bacterium]|nr:carboxymuconolactone decarboxylase family protein [Thermodesulfobacteriota bacterium]